MVKPLLDGKDFKLGLFSANCSGCMAVSKAPDRWSASWDDNLRLAKIADEVGIDFLLPIANKIADVVEPFRLQPPNCCREANGDS